MGWGESIIRLISAEAEALLGLAELGNTKEHCEKDEEKESLIGDMAEFFKYRPRKGGKLTEGENAETGKPITTEELKETLDNSNLGPDETEKELP